MNWDALRAPPDKVALARQLVQVSERIGWSPRAMRKASTSVFKGSDRWCSLFPGGPREAIWFISEMSDASMRRAFEPKPAQNMAAVIRERLNQNADLKAFVRRVMVFDIAHPVQAVSRMQRTARVMFQCLGRAPTSALQLAALNAAYTVIVFFWLCDRSLKDQRTYALTRRLMNILRL